MRLAVFVFALTLIFSTTFAHAIAFIPVASTAVGAIMRTAGGKVVKVATNKTLLTSGAGIFGYNAVSNYCKKNTSKCKDILGDVAEYFFEEEDESPDDYRQCFDSSNKYKSANPQKLCDDWLAQANSKNNRSYVFADSVVAKFSSTTNTDGYCAVYGGTNKFTGNVGTNFRCTSLSDAEKSQKKEEKEQIKKEQAQKVVQNLSDDDITYIINNYGDDIDVEKYCSENSCDEIEQKFAEEIKKNQDKYDIDKINKQNCTVKNNKIVSCKKAHKDQLEFDFEQETEEENTNIDTDIEQKEEDEEEKSCDGNELYKKMCEFMKWYQNDDEPDDTKIDIKDNDEPLQNKKVDFVGACPAKYEINFTIKMGSFYSQDINIMLLDTPKLCNFLDDWIKPIMLFLGPLHAVYILGRKE